MTTAIGRRSEGRAKLSTKLHVGSSADFVLCAAEKADGDATGHRSVHATSACGSNCLCKIPFAVGQEGTKSQLLRLIGDSY